MALLPPPGTGDGDRRLSSGERGDLGYPHPSPARPRARPRSSQPQRARTAARGARSEVPSLQGAAGRRRKWGCSPGEGATSPPEPLLEPPHGSGPPAPAGLRAGGRDGRLRTAPEAARAGVRALIGVRAAAARSDGRRRPSVRRGSRAGACGRPL